MPTRNLVGKLVDSLVYLLFGHLSHSTERVLFLTLLALLTRTLLARTLQPPLILLVLGGIAVLIILLSLLTLNRITILVILLALILLLSPLILLSLLTLNGVAILVILLLLLIGVLLIAVVHRWSPFSCCLHLWYCKVTVKYQENLLYALFLRDTVS